jgi:hypothetical protein
MSKSKLLIVVSRSTVTVGSSILSIAHIKCNFAQYYVCLNATLPGCISNSMILELAVELGINRKYSEVQRVIFF